MEDRIELHCVACGLVEARDRADETPYPERCHTCGRPLRFRLLQSSESSG